MDVTTAEPWTVAEIVKELDRLQGTILTGSGGPAVRWPKNPKDRFGNFLVTKKQLADYRYDCAKLIEHMRARRGEILEWVRLSNPDTRAAEAEAAAKSAVQLEREARAAAVSELRERAKAAGRRVWYIAFTPEFVQAVDDGGEFSPYAKWASVEGDKLWTPLPHTTPPPSEKTAVRKARAAKRKREAKKARAAKVSGLNLGTPSA